jgi:predicted CoA-binding protein
MEAWRAHLVEDPEGIARLLRECRRVAVLGIKPESRRGQPAFYVPEYALRHGYDVVPVPVYYPDVTTILGRPVYRTLAAVPPPPLDLVNVFRRPPDIPPHLPDILAARPRAVWLQLGLRHDGVAETLARAGIDVVQDRCLLVEHRRLAAAGAGPRPG